jgi:hypothetical protein
MYIILCEKEIEVDHIKGEQNKYLWMFLMWRKSLTTFSKNLCNKSRVDCQWWVQRWGGKKKKMGNIWLFILCKFDKL